MHSACSARPAPGPEGVSFCLVDMGPGDGGWRPSFRLRVSLTIPDAGAAARGLAPAPCSLHPADADLLARARGHGHTGPGLACGRECDVGGEASSGAGRPARAQETQGAGALLPAHCSPVSIECGLCPLHEGGAPCLSGWPTPQHCLLYPESWQQEPSGQERGRARWSPSQPGPEQAQATVRPEKAEGVGSDLQLDPCRDHDGPE